MGQQKKEEKVTSTGLKGLYCKSDSIWWKCSASLCNKPNGMFRNPNENTETSETGVPHVA
jgi:hypothetical protein